MPLARSFVLGFFALGLASNKLKPTSQREQSAEKNTTTASSYCNVVLVLPAVYVVAWRFTGFAQTFCPSCTGGATSSLTLRVRLITTISPPLAMSRQWTQQPSPHTNGSSDPHARSDYKRFLTLSASTCLLTRIAGFCQVLPGRHRVAAGKL